MRAPPPRRGRPPVRTARCCARAVAAGPYAHSLALLRRRPARVGRTRSRDAGGLGQGTTLARTRATGQGACPLKPVRDIDDPRLAKALSHPLRVRIMGVLEQRTATPKQLAQ